MTNTIEIYAPAKINLFLEVKDKLPNGYHNIDTVMAAVSLYDRLKVSVRKTNSEKNNIRMSGDNTALSYGNGNLCVRAANEFLQSAGISGAEVELTLQKMIPISAGLAGGSSDAAAVFRALNILFSNQEQKNQKTSAANSDFSEKQITGDLKNIPGLLADDKLSESASRIGADIPFCLNGGIAHAGGIGELVFPCETAFHDSNIRLVISIPESFSVATPYAYSLIDNQRESKAYKMSPKSSESLRNILRKQELANIKDELYNRFEDVITPLCEEITDIKKRMLESGALAALMSGSGPSVFGMFESEESAQISAAALQKYGYKSYVCRILL